MQPALLMLVMLPFWTSFLLRVYAWKGLLTEDGWVAELLDRRCASTSCCSPPGLIPAPGKLMNTPFSLVLGMVYTYLPFMILPLYGNLAKMDLRLLEAAADLGATPWVGFWKITVPLSKAGIIAGSMLVFIPCIGEFVIPELLGGPQTLMIGRVLWDEFFSNNDWPMASSVAVVMILLIIVPLAIFNKYQAEASEARAMSRRRSCTAAASTAGFARGWLAAGFVFLYLPIVALVIYLVQRLAAAQRLGRLHAASGTRALADDREMLAGLWLSLKIAFFTACGSVVLGTLAAFALVKYRRFAGPHAVLAAWSTRRW